MLRRILTRGLVSLLLLTVVSLDGFHVRVKAQQKRISREPLRLVDAETGKPIPEALIIARHSSYEGVSTLLGEGPGRGKERDYLAKPFVYRAGTPFVVKLPKSRGLPLGPLLFIGKGRTLWGVFIFAHGYRPRWFIDLWLEGPARELKLTPVSGEEEALMLMELLNPLGQGARHLRDECSFWQLPPQCDLEIHFNKKERALVRSFLQRAEKGTAK